MNSSPEHPSTAEKVERHRAFLERRSVVRPLLGFIHGWEDISKYVRDTVQFYPAGPVTLQTFTAGRFGPMYADYVKTISRSDDLFRTLEPLPFFPWAEAAIGCPITYTGKNFWSCPIEETKSDEGLKTWIADLRRGLASQSGASDGSGFEGTAQAFAAREACASWLTIYGALLNLLGEQFGSQWPIGQSILRGPLDLAAAVLGEERMIYLFFDQPALMKELLELATKVFLKFIALHRHRGSSFRNGSVIGSYYLWVPGRCLRLQEDAMALLSPQVYREFIHPLDCHIASAADYTLFHLHSTGMHLLGSLLDNPGLQIIQVSKDEGVELGSILAGLKTIQAAKKCLVLKGRFNAEELRLAKSNLDYRGLCIQAVIRDQQEEDGVCSAFG